MGLLKNTAPLQIEPEDPRAPVAFDKLVESLDSPDPAARRQAARDLGNHSDASTPLLSRLPRETEVSVKEAILTSLMRVANPEAIKGLVACLRSEDTSLRNEAIEVMKASPVEVAPLMHELLNDSDPDVRIFAINILESLRHPDVETWLIDVIEHEPMLNVCGAAVDLLSEVGTAAAHDALQHLKQRFSSEPYIQFAASLALKRIAP